MNPIDYTLEEWLDLWMQAHADDGLAFDEYLIRYTPDDTEPIQQDVDKWLNSHVADATPTTDNEPTDTGAKP